MRANHSKFSHNSLIFPLVSSNVFDQITRYTSFAAAAYADKCDTPAYKSKVIKYFSDNATDTQATLFEDPAEKELIVAFRGTSSPKDLDVDLLFTLVPLSAPGTKCSDCKVRDHHDYFEAAHCLTLFHE